MSKPTLSSAVAHVNRHHALLVYPIANKAEPLSLWSCFFPRTKMRWEWTDDADDRVPSIWHLRARLSSSGKVAYGKWYQGRATFLSLPLFTALLGRVSTLPDPAAGLGAEAQALLEVLEGDSPIGTKALREMSGTSGKEGEPAFNAGMRELWSRLLVVGYGEADEGGFPSLALGATRLLFEDQWDESSSTPPGEREKHIESMLVRQPLFLRMARTMKQRLERIPSQGEAGMTRVPEIR